MKPVVVLDSGEQATIGYGIMKNKGFYNKASTKFFTFWKWWWHTCQSRGQTQLSCYRWPHTDLKTIDQQDYILFGLGLVRTALYRHNSLIEHCYTPENHRYGTAPTQEIAKAVEQWFKTQGLNLHANIFNSKQRTYHTQEAITQSDNSSARRSLTSTVRKQQSTRSDSIYNDPGVWEWQCAAATKLFIQSRHTSFVTCLDKELQLIGDIDEAIDTLCKQTLKRLLLFSASQ